MPIDCPRDAQESTKPPYLLSQLATSEYLTNIPLHSVFQRLIVISRDHFPIAQKRLSLVRIPPGAQDIFRGSVTLQCVFRLHFLAILESLQMFHVSDWTTCCHWLPTGCPKSTMLAVFGFSN